MTDDEIQERFRDALVRLDGDIDLLCDMAALTAPDCPAVMKKVEGFLEQRDCDGAARSLHKLKGMLSTFDDGEVIGQIQELLDFARRGNLDELADCYAQRSDRIRAFIASIDGLAVRNAS